MRDSPSTDEDFTAFVAARSPTLYRSAWLLTTSAPAAEDLVQSALNVTLRPAMVESLVEIPTASVPADHPEGTTAGIGAPTPGISCAAEFSGQTTCTQLWDEQGNVIGRRLVTRWGGTVMNEVVLRRGGGTIYAAAANTVDTTWGVDSPVSAETPPLTLDQLEDLVRNDTWVMPAT